MDDETRNKRNLNPHAEARLAMLMWGKEYSEQHGGSMDFWDRLSESRKRLCKEQVKIIRETEPEEVQER